MVEPRKTGPGGPIRKDEEGFTPAYRGRRDDYFGVDVGDQTARVEGSVMAGAAGPRQVAGREQRRSTRWSPAGTPTTYTATIRAIVACRLPSCLSLNLLGAFINLNIKPELRAKHTVLHFARMLSRALFVFSDGGKPP